ncbi:vWA domain-containing protein [Lysobacter sp. A286]
MMISGRLLAAFAATFAVAGTPALAQEPAAAPAEDAILVLDASGSMWAQIDGVARITIAREVISDLLDDLPANRRLGLVAYGHNRKGDCKDIETLVEVGTDRDAIRKAVNDINPKGMTPMTAAVQQAAEALKYSENKATVILVSDGLETCNLDPCTVASTLEKNGVDLTVHTVGFGLGDDEKTAKEQLRCMADRTGGISLLASDAAELSAALQQVSAVAAEPKPEPKPESKPEPAPVETVAIKLIATDQDGGPVIKDGLAWTVLHGATGEVLFESSESGTVETKIPRGVHDVTVKRLSDGATATGAIETGVNGTRLTLPIIVELAATLEAHASAPAGSEVRVTWSGPDEADDYISIAKPDADSRKELNYTRTRSGNPLKLKLPDATGTYEIRYISNKTRDILARQAIEVTAVEAALEIRATAPAGSTITVNWTGPDYSDDYIAIAEPDADSREELNYTRTRSGNPLKLKLPDAPGTYEVRYILNQSRDILARQTIEVTAVEAALEIPATAPAGSTITVNWTGPDYTDDYIAIAEPAADSREELNYTRTRSGNPLKLKLPDAPGTYEVRYILNQSRDILARQTIEVTAVEAALEIPATAPAGSTITVNWTGPDYTDDYIAIAEPAADSREELNYTRTRSGNPLKLKLPDAPGTYEVRYILNQSRNILARQTIEVTAVEATLEIPATAPAGSTITVNWTGPDYTDDYIAIAEPDADSREELNYTRTRSGNPLKLKLPDAPGTYEVRYILNQSRNILARQTIKVHGASDN